MKNETTLRFPTPADLPEIIELCDQHAQFEEADYNRSGKQEMLRNHLFADRPTLFCLVAERKGKLVGYATYIPQFSTWDADYYLYLDCLYLTRDARGYGIGESMMDRIKKEALRLNCQTIQWQTPEFNKRAMKFYKRIGAYSKTKERFFLDL